MSDDPVAREIEQYGSDGKPNTPYVGVERWYFELLEGFVRLMIQAAKIRLHGPGACPVRCHKCRLEEKIALALLALEDVPRLRPNAPRD